MFQTNILLTQTYLDKTLLSKNIAYNFFQNKNLNFQENDISEELLNETWQHKLGSRQIMEMSFKDKEDFTKNLMSLYENYSEPTLLFMGDLSEYSLPLQEGMLRILEEPPKNLYIILFSHNKNNILPTIVSRSNFVLVPKNFVLKNLDKNLLEKVKSKLPDIKETVKTKPQELTIPDTKKTEREELDFWFWQLNFYLEEAYKQNPSEGLAKLILKSKTAQKLNQENLQKKFSLGYLKV
jgi:hypothetical protein